MVTQGPIPQAQQQIDELTALGQSIVKDQRRIQQMKDPSPAAVATEISGTLLSYDRDIVGYIARLEQSVVTNFENVFNAIAYLQQVGAGGDEDGGTQFEPEDAAKFTDFITGAKVLIQATRDNVGTSEQVRAQLTQMLAVADELLKLIDDSTLQEVDDEDEGEGDEEGTPEAGATP